ncbi:hypothetical protein, partial [Cupriavidus sp. 2MCAB6]|uniref:hypothetical protein n=1 Tax=Cupriavidus sp. 2MCAB6 TaxID=3232981 RepID=UPI003F91D498
MDKPCLQQDIAAKGTVACSGEITPSIRSSGAGLDRKRRSAGLSQSMDKAVRIRRMYRRVAIAVKEDRRRHAAVASKQAQLDAQQSLIDTARATVEVDKANQTFAEQDNDRYT